jgi:RNA polymerase sigma-70 factor, ECF subfamily
VAPFDPPDSVLIARAQAGDTEAFGQLAERYRSACYGLAFQLLGNHADAEDATWQALVNAWLAIVRFRPGNFRSWLLTITTRASLDLLRASEPTVPLPGPDPDDPDADWPDLPDPNAPDPLAEYLRKELRGYLDAALFMLPMPQRVAVVLISAYGWSHARVAAETDTLVRTVDSNLDRGLARLRVILGPRRDELFGYIEEMSQHG